MNENQVSDTVTIPVTLLTNILKKLEVDQSEQDIRSAGNDPAAASRRALITSVATELEKTAPVSCGGSSLKIAETTKPQLPGNKKDACDCLSSCGDDYDRIKSGAVEPCENYKQAHLRPPEPPLTGSYHQGNGVIVCGAVRIASADFDAPIADTLRDEIFSWICATLNKEIARFYAHQSNGIESK